MPKLCIRAYSLSFPEKTEKKSAKKREKERFSEELKIDRRHHEDHVQPGFAGQVRFGTC